MCGMLCELEVDSTEYEAVMYTETYLEDDVSCGTSMCMGWDEVEVESQMSHSPKRVPNTRHTLSISRFNRKTLDRRDRRDRRGWNGYYLFRKVEPGKASPCHFIRFLCCIRHQQTSSSLTQFTMQRREPRQLPPPMAPRGGESTPFRSSVSLCCLFTIRIHIRSLVQVTQLAGQWVA
jgi:hypothetical protein